MGLKGVGSKRKNVPKCPGKEKNGIPRKYQILPTRCRLLYHSYGCIYRPRYTSSVAPNFNLCPTDRGQVDKEENKPDLTTPEQSLAVNSMS